VSRDWCRSLERSSLRIACGRAFPFSSYTLCQELQASCLTGTQRNFVLPFRAKICCYGLHFVIVLMMNSIFWYITSSGSIFRIKAQGNQETSMEPVVNLLATTSAVWEEYPRPCSGLKSKLSRNPTQSGQGTVHAVRNSAFYLNVSEECFDLIIRLRE
jgi:hypothetical protein